MDGWMDGVQDESAMEEQLSEWWSGLMKESVDVRIGCFGKNPFDKSLESVTKLKWKGFEILPGDFRDLVSDP